MPATSLAFVARWIARIWSVVSLLFVLIFAAGHVLTPHGPKPIPQEWIGLALFPIGVGAGLLLAWHWEVFGGILALASLTGFYLWNLHHSGHLPRGPVFFLIAAPALVFLISASLTHQSTTPST